MIRDPRMFPLQGVLAIATLLAAVVVAGHARDPESPSPGTRTASESAEAVEFTPIGRASGLETAVLSPGTHGDPAGHAPEAPGLERERTVRAASSVATGHPGTAAVPGGAGMITGIDPETGRPGRPTASQRAAMRMPDLDRSSAGLRETLRADGTRVIELEGRFTEYAIVRILPDGRQEQSCVQGPMLEAALRSPAPASGAAGAGPGSAAAPGATVAREER